MSEMRNTSAPAGWYPDPHGLPQQRWWTGDQWTHAVAPARLDQLRPPQVTSQPTPQVTFALPATATAGDIFPTRRQLREEAARLAERDATPHPSAPFAMPATPFTTTAPQQQTQTPTYAPPLAVVPAIAAAPQPFVPPVVPQTVFAQPLATPPVASVPFTSAPFTPPPFTSPPSTSPPLAAVAVPQAAASTLAIASGGPSANSSWPFDKNEGSPFEPTHEVAYRPFGMIPTVKAGTAAPPDRVQTWEVWVMALLPLLAVAVGLAVVTQLAMYYTTFMQGGLALLFVLATVGLAVRDHRKLVDFGHVRTASPAWALLTPLVYLIIRSVRARGSAGRETAPLWAWVVAVLAIVGLAVWMPHDVQLIVSTTGLF